MPRTALLCALLLTVAGCLPSSCRRPDDRSLFPADSLSREIAAQAPVDTLRLLWQSAGTEEHTLKHPRTVLFGADGTVYVSDTKRNSVFVFDGPGKAAREITSDAFSFPYLAGVWGDTLLVFNPDAHRIDLVVNGGVGGSIATPVDFPRRSTLQYAAAAGDVVYFKAVSEDQEGYVARLDRDGEVVERHALAGPHWRFAGLLRPWGDSLLSLSGYRPLVDVIAPGRKPDSLALRGFDSPMLARSRSFALGHIQEAPLLTASAAPAGPFLFVLNMRPGWLRIDVYDRAGELQRILVHERPSLKQNFYPRDLAARPLPGGGFALAVILDAPQPQVHLYAWRGP